MFYREIETDDENSEIKRNSDKDETDDNDDDQIIKTTNFSISEILRPEFGQRIKEEPPYSDNFPFKQETLSAFHLVNNPANYHHSLFSFDDIFRRYKTFMCSASRTDRNFTSGQRNSSTTGSIPKETQQQREQTKKISSPQTTDTSDSNSGENGSTVWPAWVYCTRYSDRPSAGPRTKKTKSKHRPSSDEKRPRTAFTNEQLNTLKREFNECRYLTEKRRINLAKDLNLTESQIKIWFQNKRAKVKKTSDAKNTLALNLIAEGLYNHSTTTNTSSITSDED